jgi:competence protein ComEC
MKILEFPLARITSGFILGVLIGNNFKPEPFFTFKLLTSALLLLLILYFLSKKFKAPTIYFGMSATLVSILIGISTYVIHNESLNKNHYIHQISDSGKQYEITLLLIEKLKNTNLNQRYVASILTLNSKKSYGKVILNIRKDSLQQNLRIGTNLKFNSTIYKNRGPINPNQFDYGHYLENQQIYAQIYTNSYQIRKGKTTENLSSEVANFRNKIISNLEKANFKKDELGVVYALILGQQQDISPEILKDYQYAGAVHVLSVSGLHVGFILMFITVLLKPFPNTRFSATIKVIIIIISLWLFGILAGLAPSVVRSVTMFSFVAIGMHFRRTINIYHTLLVSMLLILSFKPSFLFDVGFQLSYTALFFIVWFQPLLESSWKPKNKIINYFWTIITVSFAAQIGAFPLSIYYFHQFPGLFFITNLVIIPMLSCIMIIGVFVVILAAFNWTPFYLVKTLELSITFLNKIIHWIASFEDFIFQDISFNFSMLISSYFIIFTSIIWLKKPNFIKTTMTLLAILFCQIMWLKNDYSTKNQEEYFVFNIKKNTIITERIGKQVTIYANDSILKNIDNNIAVKSYLIGNSCKIKEKKRLENFAYFNNKKVYLLDSSSIYSSKIKPDILIITQSPKVNLERLLKIIQPKEVVFDGSNFKSYVKLWEATCRKEKIPFHNTNEKGYYKF